jgi:hypothetical protein
MSLDPGFEMAEYFVHNGYCGWAYGTPSNPQLVSAEDAARLMAAAGLRDAQVEVLFPAAQFASEGDRLFTIAGGNRFIFRGDPSQCADVDSDRTSSPLSIDWGSGAEV